MQSRGQALTSLLQQHPQLGQHPFPGVHMAPAILHPARARLKGAVSEAKLVCKHASLFFSSQLIVFLWFPGSGKKQGEAVWTPTNNFQTKFLVLFSHFRYVEGCVGNKQMLA